MRRAAWWLWLVGCGPGAGDDPVDTDVADTDAAETDAADTDGPDSDIADTDSTDTDARDTDVPDTDPAPFDGYDAESPALATGQFSIFGTNEDADPFGVDWQYGYVGRYRVMTDDFEDVAPLASPAGGQHVYLLDAIPEDLGGRIYAGRTWFAVPVTDDMVEGATYTVSFAHGVVAGGALPGVATVTLRNAGIGKAVALTSTSFAPAYGIFTAGSVSYTVAEGWSGPLWATFYVEAPTARARVALDNIAVEVVGP